MINKLLFKHKKILGVALILLVCLLAYGQILQMFFYLEDYLILYSVQHPDSPEAGYGSGIVGRPFGWAVTPFIPFYYIFGLEPQGYYLVEILLYFTASIAVYLFTKTLTGNKYAALGASLVFASGYVGSGSLYRMAAGWQNLLAAIFISLSATLYFKYVKTPKLKYYLLAFVFYLFTSEFSFYRAHGIILVILGIEVFFNFKLLKSIIRMLPFVVSYWYFYVYSLPFMDQGSKTTTFIRTVFQEGNLNYLLTPLKTLENLFIPDKFNFPILVFLLILGAIMIWKRSKILLYCLFFALANYIVHFYNSPAFAQETVHRYLTVSFVGIAAFWGIFLHSVFKNESKYLLACLLLVALNITLARQEQTEILQNRSGPNREFWQTFQREIKSLQPYSAIYIDSENDGISKPARDAALSAGSLSATTSFAMFYGLKWDEIYLAENFSELLSFVKSGKASRDNIFTFYYSKQRGLVNTTEETKKALAEGGSLDIDDIKNINLAYSSPLLLDLTSQVTVDISEAGRASEPNFEKYLNYFPERDNYYKNTTASVTSEVRYAEIRNIKDRDLETTWRADDTKWTANHDEEIVLNLGGKKEVGLARIKPGHPTRVPTKYSWECSLDLKIWTSLGSFERKPTGSEEFVDKLNNGSCVYLKLIINSTVSGPPQISEVEVVEERFSGLDFTIADKIEDDPFSYTSASSRNALLNHFAKNGIVGKVCVYTEKYNTSIPKCIRHNFVLGTSSDSYFIDQGGLVLQRIEVVVPKQVKVDLQNMRAKRLSYEELDKRGYIFPVN